MDEGVSRLAWTALADEDIAGVCPTADWRDARFARKPHALRYAEAGMELCLQAHPTEGMIRWAWELSPGMEELGPVAPCMGLA